MRTHVIIDGNNLLYAMHDHAPVPLVGRETLVKVIERWAANGNDEVTLVFDGAAPFGGMAKQMSSKRIEVRFSAPATADDVIADLVQCAAHPDLVRVISSDTALRHEASRRRCRPTDSVAFVSELFATPDKSVLSGGPGKPEKPAATDPPEKPSEISQQETDDWLTWFGLDKP